MRIRAATAADAAAILDVWTRAGSVPTVTDDRDALLTLIDRDPGALLVAEHDGAITGTLIAGTDGWRGNLHRLAIVPEHRGKGWARALVDAARERFAALGVRRVTLIVERDDEQAMAVWRAFGFTHDGHITRFHANL